MTPEQKHQRRTLLQYSKNPDIRLFRNNVGMGWCGKIIRRTVGMITLDNPRVLQAGLHKGSADLIGWKTVTVTPKMVGQKLAVFLSVEIKTKTGRMTREQKNWMKQVNAAGGIAVVEREEK
jgi:hypothetical protein